MIDLRDKQTYFTAATDTLWERDKHIFRCKEMRTHILLQKDTLCFFTARRQTTLFYYTDTNTYILWQRDRQNYFTTQTNTHILQQRDKTVSLHRCKHRFIAAKRQTHFPGLKGPWELGKMDKVQENKCTTRLNCEYSGLLRHIFWAGLSPYTPSAWSTTVVFCTGADTSPHQHDSIHAAHPERLLR